jgi:hypothetical protein
MQGAVPGHKYVFKLDNAAGVLVDLSQYTPKGALGISQEVYDVTTADGSASRGSMLGLKGGDEFTIEFLYHDDLEAILAAVYALTTGASQTYEYGPNTSAAGKPRYTGECFLMRYQLDNAVGGPATMNATFKMTGTQTRNTWP